MTRVAVLDRDNCRPQDCNNLCYRVCPENRMKVFAITFEEGEKKPTIVEQLCTGCGICIRKCPFDAISIINLPEELKVECTHRYGKNAFKLFRLPTPTPGLVTGLLGKNATGKTTALRILSGQITPNLGRHEAPPDWSEIIKTFRGSILQDFFQRLRGKQFVVVHKPQYIDKIPDVVKGTVKDVLEHSDQRGEFSKAVEMLELNAILGRDINLLSGGEFQRMAIAAAVCREGDLYIFDEPSSYLDVRQRIRAAKIIRSLTSDGKTVLVAEHDIAMLDYLSDHICILYGEPGVYGIVSKPHAVRGGINIYLEGYLPDDNMRFRNEPIKFHISPFNRRWESSEVLFEWGYLHKDFQGFQLSVESGKILKGEVIGILGPNGIGKTTFVKLLAGLEKPTQSQIVDVTRDVTLSYKPQYLSTDRADTVLRVLKEAAGPRFNTSLYKTQILDPLRLDKIGDRILMELSGGELQKVAVAECLSRNAQLYLIDEPSAFLDVEERLTVAGLIRRVVESMGVAAIVVEHDVIIQDFLADRLMPFKGIPTQRGEGYEPMDLRRGMNMILKDLNLTFRRDAVSGRPRVNKESSQLDRRQKDLGEYYYVPLQES